MRLLLQNNKAFNETAIPKFGCYFMALLALQYFIKRSEKSVILDSKKVLEFYYEMLQKRYIGNDCFISRPDKIVSSLGLGKCTITVGDKSHKPTTGQWLFGVYRLTEQHLQLADENVKKQIEAIIPCFHFVLLDQKMKVIYDGYGDSLTCKHGDLYSLRIYDFQK